MCSAAAPGQLRGIFKNFHRILCCYFLGTASTISSKLPKFDLEIIKYIPKIIRMVTLGKHQKFQKRELFSLGKKLYLTENNSPRASQPGKFLPGCGIYTSDISFSCLKIDPGKTAGAAGGEWWWNLNSPHWVTGQTGLYLLLPKRSRSCSTPTTACSAFPGKWGLQPKQGNLKGKFLWISGRWVPLGKGGGIKKKKKFQFLLKLAVKCGAENPRGEATLFLWSHKIIAGSALEDLKE